MQSSIAVQAKQVDYICDKCKEGKMRPTGMVLLLYPALYPHKCNKCGVEKTFKVRYPHMVYEETKENTVDEV